MNFKRLLNTDLGRIVISILLGLGLATLFKKVCNDKNCMVYSGPIIQDLEGKTYKHNNKCYTYTSEAVSCDSTKHIVDITSIPDENAKPKGMFGY
jgi:hypothetical protein